jgi:hypothetical protein
MGTILKNIVAFSELELDTPVSLPHRLNVNGIPAIPQLVGADAAGFTIEADATDVTVTRTATSVGDAVNIYVEHWHTIESVTPLVPPPGHLTGQVPFILASGGAGSSLQTASARVAFDGSALASHGCATSKTGQGQYHVDFTPPFADDVAVTAVLNQDSQNGSVIYVVNVTNTGFDVITRENTDGWLFEDLPWSFNALPAEAIV